MKFLLLSIGVAVLFALNIFVGSVSIPAAEVWDALTGSYTDSSGPLAYIVVGSRLPQAVTALLAGASLALAGLLLQTTFHNPLAGPSILGISGGASLGVALVMLLLGGSLTAGSYALGGYAAVIAAAFAGSMAIMALLIFFSIRLKNNLVLLIAGIMTGYLTSSLITLLSYFSSAEGIQGYVMWGMGNFSSVSLHQLPLFILLSLPGIVMSLLMIKPLTLLQLGERYAENLGVNINRMRNMLLLATGLLTAVATAFCGPISFIGLAVPHIARMIFRSADQRVLMPATLLSGGAVALLCNLICILPRDILLPLNGVTPIIGVPVIMYVIFSKNFNRRRL